MVVEVKGIQIFINYKLRDFFHKQLIVDDLLDGDDSVLDFKKKYKFPTKANITRFTDVKVIKG